MRNEFWLNYFYNSFWTLSSILYTRNFFDVHIVNQSNYLLYLQISAQVDILVANRISLAIFLLYYLLFPRNFR